MIEAVKVLKKLYQLDVDAVEAYEQAIKHVDNDDVHTSLKQFQKDHKRHIQDLGQVLKDLGEAPPKRTADLQGYLLAGFTALRSVTGIEGALKAMHTNEQKTNENYEEALRLELPAEILSLIQKNYADEQRHIAYIERTLNNRPWELPHELNTPA